MPFGLFYVKKKKKFPTEDDESMLQEYWIKVQTRAAPELSKKKKLYFTSDLLLAIAWFSG